jgi:hypothetical protein
MKVRTIRPKEHGSARSRQGPSTTRRSNANARPKLLTKKQQPWPHLWIGDNAAESPTPMTSLFVMVGCNRRTHATVPVYVCLSAVRFSQEPSREPRYRCDRRRTRAAPHGLRVQLVRSTFCCKNRYSASRSDRRLNALHCIRGTKGRGCGLLIFHAAWPGLHRRGRALQSHMLPSAGRHVQARCGAS